MEVLVFKRKSELLAARTIYKGTEGVGFGPTVCAPHGVLLNPICTEALQQRSKLNKTKVLQPQLNSSYLVNSQLLDIKYIKLPRMLKYTDRMSMRFGVEARVPFLDHELFEYCFNLNHNFKFKNEETRYLLKKVSREINSKISFKKNKINIVDPQTSWLKTHLKDYILDELSSLDFINNDFINYKNTKKMLNFFFKSKNVKSSYLIFKILTAHKFIQNFKNF